MHAIIFKEAGTENRANTVLKPPARALRSSLVIRGLLSLQQDSYTLSVLLFSVRIQGVFHFDVDEEWSRSFAGARACASSL
jgi:hypothetical protein